MMLAQLLAVRGVKTELVSSKILVGEMLTQVAEQGARVVCISAPPPSRRPVRKRLRPKFLELPIVVAHCTVGASTKATQNWLSALNIRDFVTTLAEATERIARLASQHRLMPASEPPPVSDRVCNPVSSCGVLTMRN